MTDPTGVPPRAKWAICVVSADGDVMYLRHGAKIGAGAVVQFRSKRTAEINIELLANGLDDDQKALIVRYDTSLEEA